LSCLAPALVGSNAAYSAMKRTPRPKPAEAYHKMKAVGYRLQATVSNQNRNVPFSVRGLSERGAGPRARHPRWLADSIFK